ncbi:hypothetical protein [Candidatus Accumulibacter aalborgensis]|uniref:hypothetical protein n=1 Tax=Candidatus Accumulibacter aalborgensis TaxID=1860102 RepID=UPI001646A9C4|nr:hypothetical protein [Candidatus Accumulibacter aalborgensis]
MRFLDRGGACLVPPCRAPDWLEAAMMLNREETRDLYRRRAKRYDLSIQLYRLSGFAPENAVMRYAIDAF